MWLWLEQMRRLVCREENGGELGNREQVQTDSLLGPRASPKPAYCIYP